MNPLVYMLLGVIGVGIYIYSLFFYISPPKSPECHGVVQAKIVRGISMEPTFYNGEGVVLYQGYYKLCNNEISMHDIVAYDRGSINELAVKRVYAVPGDMIEFSDGYMLKNGQLLRNVYGELFYFTPTQQKLLGLSLTQKVIPQNTYFIFGDNILGSRDSRSFGAISGNDIVGKFFKK